MQCPICHPDHRHTSDVFCARHDTGRNRWIVRSDLPIWVLVDVVTPQSAPRPAFSMRWSGQIVK